MTITTLIIINIAFILGISLAFILGRKSVMKKAKNAKAKKLKKKAKKTKKIKAKVTHGNAETPSKKAVSDQKKGRKSKKVFVANAEALAGFEADYKKIEQVTQDNSQVQTTETVKAESSVIPSYDQANMGHHPELNLDPDEYIKNMPKMMEAK